MSKTTKAGAIPFYNGNVVLVDSLRHPGRLVLPKGKIKKGENPLDAAARETLEESGAVGTIDPTVVFYNDSTVYYLMRVEDLLADYDEKGERGRTQLKPEYVEESSRIKNQIKRIIRDAKAHMDP